jgi:secondary thiamine-phosphate synthase enzyme
MKIITKDIEVHPGPGFSILNITDQVNEFVASTGVQEGQLTAFYKHTTGSVFLGEHESGIIADVAKALEAIAPMDGEYLHHQREWDFNGSAHVRAAFMSISITVPIHEGYMVLGTHQEILVANGQPEAFPRYLVLQVMGE